MIFRGCARVHAVPPTIDTPFLTMQINMLAHKVLQLQVLFFVELLRARRGREQAASASSRAGRALSRVRAAWHLFQQHVQAAASCTCTR